MRRTVMWLLGSLLLTACSFVRPARAPMERVSFRERGPDAARGAIILLPGFGDRPKAFEKNGFVEVLSKHAPEYDVFAADAHFAYYRKRRLLPRLEEDVIGPLKKRGYRELWIAGASMGGMGTVAYARTHPEGVRGIMLFAPYMGPRKVLDEVAKTGLCKYEHTLGAIDDEAEFARANFLWLKRQACEEKKVSIFLGVGDRDRLLFADRLLGAALPAERVVVLPGGHAWKVWTPALERLAPLAFDTPGASD